MRTNRDFLLLSIQIIDSKMIRQSFFKIALRDFSKSSKFLISEGSLCVFFLYQTLIFISSLLLLFIFFNKKKKKFYLVYLNFINFLCFLLILFLSKSINKFFFFSSFFFLNFLFSFYFFFNYNLVISYFLDIYILSNKYI